MSNAENFNITINPIELNSYNDSIELTQQNSCILELQPFKSKYVRTKKEQEYLKDIWSVQEVSFTFEGISKPSATVEKVLLSRKSDHDIALQSFNDELENLYETCLMNIQELKKNLRSKINSIRLDIKNKKNDFCLTTCANNEEYEELEAVVHEMLNEEMSIIDNCFQRIYDIEIKCQSRATEIFKKYYKILQKICYLQSNDAQRLMRNKIMDYNERALETRKKYEDLKLKFDDSVNDFKENFYAWIKEAKKNKFDICRKTLITDFHTVSKSLRDAAPMFLKTLEGGTAFCRLKSRKNLITEKVAQWDLTIPYSVKRIDRQSCQLNFAIYSIESTIRNFISSYRLYVSKFVCKLFDQMLKLKDMNDIYELSVETDTEEIENIYNCEKQRTDDFLAELANTGCKIIKKLQAEAEKTFKPFQDFGSPWQVQSERVSKLQDSIVEQLKSRAQKSLLTHFDIEKIINTEISSLRQEGSVEKLDKKLAQLFVILDKKVTKHKSDYEESCKIIKKCKNAVTKEVKAAKNKIDKFLEINKDGILESSENLESLSECGENNSLADLDAELELQETTVLQELQLIEKQIASLDNLKSNYLKNISSYQSFFEKDVIATAESWENELLLTAYRHFEDNLKSVENLREKITKEIYNIRLKELLDHQSKLEQHKKMITGLIQESAKCADTFLNFTDAIETYEFEINQMLEEHGPKVKNSSQIMCLQNMLQKLKEDCKNKINAKINCTSGRMMKKVSLMKHYNESFLSNIIVFEEGGDFDVEESNLFKKEIIQLFKDIQKDEYESCQKVKKTINHVNCQIENIEKCLFESLNITIKKLKVKEDIINAIRKCEFLVELKKQDLIKLFNQTTNEIMNFKEKCQSRLPLNEITVALSQSMKKIQDNINFIKQPIPNIEIPKNIKYSSIGLKNDTGKEKNSKGNKLQEKSSPPNNQNNIMNNEHCNEGLNNFASVAKFIQDALIVINDNAKIYYTLLMNKPEHLLIPNNNESCENYIDKSLNFLFDIYTTACNCWVEETNRLSDFFKKVKIPSVESYLIDRDLSDAENETVISMENYPNHRISVALDQNFTKFQKTLQETLCLLQSKDINMH